MKCEKEVKTYRDLDMWPIHVFIPLCGRVTESSIPSGIKCRESLALATDFEAQLRKLGRANCVVSHK